MKFLGFSWRGGSFIAVKAMVKSLLSPTMWGSMWPHLLLASALTQHDPGKNDDNALSIKQDREIMFPSVCVSGSTKCETYLPSDCHSGELIHHPNF